MIHTKQKILFHLRSKFYLTWKICWSILIISSIATSTTYINTGSKWITKFIRVYTSSLGLTWHGQLFRDTRFIRPLELESNVSLKRLVVKELNNPINIFLTNPNIIAYCVFSLNIYEYPKYHQHQYYHQ